MRLSVCVLLILSSVSALALNKTGFAGIRCDSKITQALVGRQMENEPVQDIEKKYRQLNLQDIGADQINDQWSLITWKICGRFFVLLQRDDDVEDVIQLPPVTSEETPVLLTCRAGSKKLQNVLPLKRKGKILKAWQVDLHAKKLNPLVTTDLSCP